MARFCALYSGSSGNSLYVASGGAALLVDAGVSCKALLTALHQRELDVSSLAGILVTHEHIDHVRGLAVLLKRLTLPVYGSRGTLAAIEEKLPPSAQLHVLEGPAEIGGMEVAPFSTPHDAAEPMGFRIHTADGRTVGVATDLGHVTDQVDRALSGCDLVALEANYDPEMLRCGPYPYSLKRRIFSWDGHLSNSDCAAQALRLVQSGTTRLILGHLSKENNLPGLARETVQGTLEQEGCVNGVDFTLQVARRSEASPVVVF